MEKEVDARGLACPQPVLLAKKALEEGGTGIVRVVVDNETACDNVQRFAESQGCDVIVEAQGEGFVLRVKRPGLGGADTPVTRAAAGGDEVVLICTDVLGKGDVRLGAVLMKAFLNTLVDADPRPTRLLFMNEGVRLTCEASEVLDVLGEFQRRGVGIFSCGTCLEFYYLREKLKVGEVTNMFEIVKSLTQAAKVIGI